MSTITKDAEGPQPGEQWSRLPAELRAPRQWAVAGTDKRPMTADGRPASVTDPTTWTDFDAACRAAAAGGTLPGFILREDDPFACIDLDVKDDTTPEQMARFERVIDTMDSYTERSKSGRGWHVWVLGKVGKGRRRDGVEVYSQERFIICTGDVTRTQPVAARQPVLDKLVGEMGPPAPPEIPLTGDDQPDLALAERARNDAGDFGRLFRGELDGLGYATQSEADLALAKLLLPISASPRECWATFRLSMLGQREKARRPDYARRTLAVAAQHLGRDAAHLEHGREVAAVLMRQADAPQPSPYLRLLLDDDLDSLPSLRWCVKGLIPDAGIGAIYGDSGTYKSFLTLDLLAHISNGNEWFGHRVKAAPAVYIPFEGQGGIPSRVRAWRLAQTAQRNSESLAAFAPDPDIRSKVAVIMEPLNLRDPADRDRLVRTLTTLGWAGGVLCVDTLAHASAGIDENSSAMGQMIGIFRDLQHRLGGVILLVHHSGKDQSKGMRGWSGLHAAMDFVVECQRDGDGEAREAQFKLSKVKDGTTGTVFQFKMQLVHLGFDEDNDPITSLAVCSPEPRDASENPFKSDVNEAQEATDDDTFVEAWIRELATAGTHPSGRSLEARRATVKARRNLTQKRLRDALERLKADGRLGEEGGGASGSKWLRPIDLPTELGA